MVKYIFILCTLLLSVSFNSFAVDKVTASVDKNPVNIDESFVLDVVAEGDVQSNQLDTSALLKNFIVGSTSTSSQTSIINGETSKKTTWRTVLLAKDSGKFIIPALTVEGKNTAPIALIVTDQPVPETTKTKDIYLTNELSSESIYVQQQATLTVKLHLGVNIERGSLSEPLLEDANISQLGQDTESEEIINGRRYRIIERKYIINPQKSGEFTITPPMFSGDVSTGSSRRGLFGFNETKPVNIRSKKVTLNVKAKPQAAAIPWLPSELFAIHQEWQPQPDSFTVGEPITRTITITAVGLSKEQLPTITLPVPDSIKVYPDQVELHTGINSGKVVSQAKMNFALVAEKSGSFTLPEVRIAWWNTVTNQQEFAILPEQEVFIKANPNNLVTPKVNKNLENKTVEQTTEPEIITVKHTSWLQWLFLGLWILTSILWLVSWLSSKTQKQIKTPPTASHNNTYKNLILACNSNDGKQVLLLLLPWLQTIIKDTKINHITEGLMVLNDHVLTRTVEELQQSYYSKSPQPWQANELKAAIKKVNNHFTQAKESDNMSLNP